MNKKQIRMIAVALVLGNVMTGLDGAITNIAIPAIVSTSHGIQFMGWVVVICLLGVSASIPIRAKIGEKATNKLVLEIAPGLSILGSTLEGLTSNIYFFLVARMIMGTGGGGVGSLPYTIAGYIFLNIKKRARILGYLTASFNGAAVLGLLVGGWLIDALSWHWIFYINVPTALVALLIASIYYRPVTPRSAPVFDLGGAFLLVSGLTTPLVGIQLLGLTVIWIVAELMLLSLVLLIFLSLHEIRAENLIIPLSILRNRSLSGDLVLFAITWGTFITMNTYLPIRVQVLLGISALVGGMILIPNSVVKIIASQTVVTIQEKTRIFTLIMIGIVTMMVSSGGLFLASNHTSLWVSILIGVFSRIGVGSTLVALQVKVQIDTGTKDMAATTSISYLIRTLAQTAVAVAYGVIMNLASAGETNSHNNVAMKMTNELGDTRSTKLLPRHLLPGIRKIFHSGIHEVVAISFILLLIATVFNFYFNFKQSSKKIKSYSK